MQTQKTKGGYLVSYSLPTLIAPQNEVSQLSDSTGFPIDLPDSISVSMAWRRATNVQRRVDPLPDAIAKLLKKGESFPIVKLRTVDVSRRQPVLVRQYRLSIAILRDDVKRQVEDILIAIARLDNGKAEFIAMPEKNMEKWVQPDFAENFVDALNTNFKKHLNMYTDTDIRDGVKRWLDTHHNIVLRGSGGLYFIPANGKNIETELNGFVAFINGLDIYKTETAYTTSRAMVYRVTKDGDAFNALSEIKNDFEFRIAEKIAELSKTVKQAKHYKGKRREKALARTLSELYMEQARIEKFKAALGEQFSTLETITETAIAELMPLL